MVILLGEFTTVCPYLCLPRTQQEQELRREGIHILKIEIHTILKKITASAVIKGLKGDLHPCVPRISPPSTSNAPYLSRSSCSSTS